MRDDFRLFSLIGRFWARVEKTDGCWLWCGMTNKDGYGRIGVGGSHVLAHRLSWMLHNGYLPSGEIVLHRCDNPPCVNPSHLWTGTNSENQADSRAKGRAAPPPIMRGEMNPASRLTEERVRALRGLHAGGQSIREIARRTGLSRPAIAAMLHRKTWAHI